MMNINYIENVEKFCKEYNINIDIDYLCKDYYFEGDREKRNIFNVTIERNGESFSFKYGDSIYNSMKARIKKPSKYDVLSCLTFYDVGDFDDFINDYGYSFSTEKEYIKVKQIYFNVKNEYENVQKIFGNILIGGLIEIL